MKKHFLKASAGILFALWLSSLPHTVSAQDLQKQYKVVNRSISAGPDGSIHLNGADNDGIAWINGKNFTSGTIELDIKGKNKLQGSFVGIAFHGVDDATYEAVYFRAFNFRSDDPVRKAHAVQYIANPNYDWPKLRSDFPGKYEQPISPAPDPDQWFHVRIVVESEKISVYVNDNKQPSLTVAPLVKLSGKMIGYWVGNTSEGDWKNLKVSQ